MSNATTTMTLIEFLLARIAEDEAANDATVTAEVERCRADGMPDLTEQEIRDYWADQHWWIRLQAEVEAKRRIVSLHPEMLEWCQGCAHELHPCRTLLTVAAVYADHPDYREEWRP